MKIVGDILDEILTRLPVKSLLRFKVVCKEWYYNIQSDFFIAKRIKNQTTKALIYHNQRGGLNLVVSICSEEEKKDEDDDDNGLTLFHQDQQYSIQEMPLDYFRYYEANTRPDDYYDFPSAHVFKPLNYHQLYYVMSMPLHYLKYYCEDVQVVDTWNGIVCLDYTDWSEEKSVYKRVITLWNPATRDFKTLPSREPCHTRKTNQKTLRASDHIGFGFDSTSNDYKVIQIFQFFREGYINQAMIYSLNTNSWRELDYSNVSSKIRSISRCGSSTIFLREKVYWVIISYDMVYNPVLLSFDMGKEVFQLTTPLPSEFKALWKQFYNTEFYTLHDSIALVLHGGRETSEKTLAIWTTKELGQGHASWIKVLNIGHALGIARPLGFWKCKRSSDYLFLFIHFNYGKTDSDRNMNAMKGIYINDRGELKDDKIMTIKVMDNIVLPLKVVRYVETLVPINRS